MIKCGAGTRAGGRALARPNLSRLKAARRHEWRPHVDTQLPNDLIPRIFETGLRRKRGSQFIEIVTESRDRFSAQ